MEKACIFDMGLEVVVMMLQEMRFPRQDFFCCSGEECVRDGELHAENRVVFVVLVDRVV